MNTDNNRFIMLYNRSVLIEVMLATHIISKINVAIIKTRITAQNVIFFI